MKIKPIYLLLLVSLVSSGIFSSCEKDNQSGTAPVADFIADKISIKEQDSITFTNKSKNTPTSWTWDFGDGEISTQANPSHTFKSSNKYSISLTVTNAYGSDTETKTNYINVTTIDGPGAGLTDYDGNIYTSIIIGAQEWMAENLKVTHYPNGDTIKFVTDNNNNGSTNDEWGNLVDDNTSDAMCYYNNNENDEADTYGALYTYAAAIGDNWTKDNTINQGVCPDGWHLPTDAEWLILETYLDTNQASKLANNETLWINGYLDQNTNFATSGFSALPSGNRGGVSGSFGNIKSNCYWWTSTTESGSIGAYIRQINYGNSNVKRYLSGKSSGYSVRCVKN